jgi:single-stranded DNA-binding protein
MEEDCMDYNQLNNNKVFITGKVISEPVYSHEIYGEGFYEINLSVPRLSSQHDIIPVTISERLIYSGKIEKEMEISIKGQFRSYNKIIDGKSRLMLTVFARELVEVDSSQNPNIIELSGYICKPPIYRTTPFNREICDILLAVNRAYNKSDYIPCIAWGRNARFVKGIEVGGRVFVVGRIQSREYQKKVNETEFETKTAYEISITKISIENNVNIINVNKNETEENTVSEEPELLFDQVKFENYYN